MRISLLLVRQALELLSNPELEDLHVLEVHHLGFLGLICRYSLVPSNQPAKRGEG